MAALAALVLLVLSGAAVQPASAHAVLESADPEDGVRLEASPGEIRLRFSEPVALTGLQILGPGARPAAAAADARVENQTVRVPLDGRLGPGTWVVTYRITSADGHPVAGSIAFAIGAEVRRAEADGSDLPSWIPAVNRAVHYGTLLASAGGCLFLPLVAGRRPVPPVLRGGLLCLSLLAGVSLMLSVGINGLLLDGSGMPRLFSASPWTEGMRTSLAGSAVAGLSGLLLLALGLLRPDSRAGRALMTAGSLAALLSLPLTGHAATAPPQMLSAAAVYVHGLAGAVWIGSLFPLFVFLRRLGPPESAPIVRRFSGLALISVAVLTAAGLVLSTVQLGSLPAVVTTPYGWIWGFKMAAFALLLGLAVLNRLVLTPRLDLGRTTGLRLSVVLEMAVLVPILVATSLLGQTPPPRALDMRDHADHGHHHRTTPASVQIIELVSGEYRARLEVAPARVGRNAIALAVEGKDGQSVEAREVLTVWSLPSSGIEGFERPVPVAPGGRAAGELEIPLAGDWLVRVEVLVSDFEKRSFTGRVAVAAEGG